MFQPSRVVFEKASLDYPLGNELYEGFIKKREVEVTEVAANRIKSVIPGDNLAQQYHHGKETLVVGVKRSLKFQSCKPSAHYQLPLVSGCMGQCEYCYKYPAWG